MANVTYDSKNVTITLQSIKLQTELLMGLDIDIPEKSTLNEHLKINAGVTPESQDYKMEWLVLGNGGHKVTTISGIAVPIPVKHSPKAAAPNNIIPIVVREMDNDVSDTERERLGLRSIEEYSGTRYIVYRAVKMDWAGVKVQEYKTTYADGSEDVDTFEYSDDELYPKQQEMPDYNVEVDDQVEIENGTAVSAYATPRIEIDEWLIQEIVNAANVVYGNANAAVVSEFAICSGVTAKATGPSATGSDISYNEVFNAQVCIFIATFENFAIQNKSLAYTIEVGNSEPMLVSSSTAATTNAVVATSTANTLV